MPFAKYLIKRYKLKNAGDNKINLISVEIKNIK